MPLVGGEHFFDGFGFAPYIDRFGWAPNPIDERERRRPPQKPLLPFIEQLDRQLPKKWDRISKDLVSNDDWVLWDLRKDDNGAQFADFNVGRTAITGKDATTAGGA